MNGYSSHTYSWINAAGELFWVKYHFKTDQGIDFLTQEDADRIAGEDGDYHQRDLFDSIEAGNHPSWTLKMQIMPFEDAKTYRYNPFDLTKVWPHGDYPLIDVGKMTLDRNVVDYHAQIEQAAFEPNNIVPGTGLSPDKMLLARGFSYSDAHRARLGVNYKQIPVNEPKVEVNATPRTARCGSSSRTDPVYAPNSMGGPVADPARAAEVHWTSDGDMVRTAYTLRPEDDDWGQAGMLVREVLDDEQRERLASNIIGHVSRRREGAGAVAGVRVLAQRRPRPRQEGRGRRPGQQRLVVAFHRCPGHRCGDRGIVVPKGVRHARRGGNAVVLVRSVGLLRTLGKGWRRRVTRETVVNHEAIAGDPLGARRRGDALGRGGRWVRTARRTDGP